MLGMPLATSKIFMITMTGCKLESMNPEAIKKPHSEPRTKKTFDFKKIVIVKSAILTIVHFCFPLAEDGDSVEKNDDCCNDKDCLYRKTAPIRPKSGRPFPVKVRLLLQHNVSPNNEPQN